MPAKAGLAAQAYLESKNVRVLNNTPYGQTTAKEVGADFVIECIG